MKLPIHTERLTLRCFRKTDLKDLHEYLSDPEVVKFEPYSPMTLDEVRENLNWRISTEEMLAMEMKETGKLIGNIYLSSQDFESYELGYVMNRSYWGQGLAAEACRATIKAVFAEGAHRIFAECDPLNSASCHLLERLGFIREAHLHKNIFFHRDANGEPIWKDTYIYSMLRDEE